MMLGEEGPAELLLSGDSFVQQRDKEHEPPLAIHPGQTEKVNKDNPGCALAPEPLCKV